MSVSEHKVMLILLTAKRVCSERWEVDDRISSKHAEIGT
jgi:hypothetical protein